MDYIPETVEEGEREILIKYTDKVIKKKDIKSKLNAQNCDLIEFYLTYRRYSWPYAGGWREQPVSVLYICKALDVEWDHRENNRKRAEQQLTESKAAFRRNKL